MLITVDKDRVTLFNRDFQNLVIHLRDANPSKQFLLQAHFPKKKNTAKSHRCHAQALLPSVT